MKIAEVVATFPPHHGGMGYVCFYNAMELARRGHDVTVFTLDRGQAPLGNAPEEFRVKRLRTPLSMGDGGIVPQLFTLTKGFDVVHLHYPFYGGAEYVYLASLLRGQRYLLTYHMDVYGDTLLKNAIIRTYEAVFMKRIIRGAALVGALTPEHIKSSKAARFIDWNRVVEMPNGVDTERFSPGRRDASLVKKYGLEERTVVLFVGNLQPFKGLHLLMEAVSRTRKRDLVLLVVGGGYGEREYRRRVREMGLEDRVIFAGPKSRDLPEHYRLGDFLVLPSTHSEAFPLVVLEAMASGIPAIVSSLPGPSGLVREGTDGLVVRVGDVEDLREKIEYLAGNTGIRSAMGREARKKVVERYGWKSIGDRLESTLMRLCAP